jgi:hypothetical protein
MLPEQTQHARRIPRLSFLSRQQQSYARLLVWLLTIANVDKPRSRESMLAPPIVPKLLQLLAEAIHKNVGSCRSTSGDLELVVRCERQRLVDYKNVLYSAGLIGFEVKQNSLNKRALSDLSDPC